MKKNKIIVTLLVIIIVLLIGIIGFGGYKYMELQKNNDKLTNDNKTITEELNKQKEETEKAKTEQEKASSTNDYSLFVKQMKETRSKMTYVDEFSGKKHKTSFTETVSNWRVDNLAIYTVELTNDGVLTVGPNNDSRPIEEIAKNVLFYRLENYGNSGYRALYYVTEDGKAYMADVEGAMANKRSSKIKTIDGVSNVVNIVPSSSTSAGSVAFVDINGNIQVGNIN